MSRKTKFFSALTLFIVLTLSLVPAVAAFEGREGNDVLIAADETIADDLYVAAETIVIDGVIQGDLVAAAETIIINGEVEGDLIAAAQNVIINGSIADDTRVFSAAMLVAPEATLGDDLLYAGASLETKAGSMVEGDLLVGAAQALVAGDTGEDLFVGVSAFELSGRVGGDVEAYVDPSEDGETMPPMFWGPSMEINIPSVTQGITITKTAQIEGNLSYTAAEDLTLPAEQVGGEISRLAYADFDEEYAPEVSAPSTQELVGAWALGVLRTIFSLLLVGLLLGWLFPDFLAAGEYTLRTNPLPSLGWGVVAYAAFFFALLVVFTGMIIGAILLGFISLGGLSGLIVMLGLLLLFALVLGFVFTVVYLSHILVSRLGGNLILARVKPEWVNHRVYPLLLGVILLSLLVSIPFVGWLFKLVVVLLALGALWILGSKKLGKKEAALQKA